MKIDFCLLKKDFCLCKLYRFCLCKKANKRPLASGFVSHCERLYGFIKGRLIGFL